MQVDDTQMGCRESDEFHIGDFVWGNKHGHLWWPGQVCDPSEASKQARNSEHLDHQVLVAYFGDSTLAWCESFELKPFKEEFQQIVNLNSSLSQSFVSAVRDAMYEIERCLRSDMTCYCVPPEKVVQFRIGRSNGIGKASIANYSPVVFLNHLQDVAQDVSVANMLGVTMLRSWAASFFLRNECFTKMIEDLFDEKQTDLNALPDNSYKERRRRGSGRVVRRPQISEDESSRKKRSMAELIQLADPEVVQHSVAEDMLEAVEDETIGQINSGLLINQKKKKSEKEKAKVPGASVTKFMHEEENGSTRRERKKSKYLSPPYTSGYKERSNSFKLVDSEVSENDSDTSQHLHTKFTYISGCEASTKEGDPITLSSNYNEASTHNILRKLLFAASSPLHWGRNFPKETFQEFFLNRRSLVYSGILEPECLPDQCSDSGSFGNHEMESNEVTSGKKRSGRRNEYSRENGLGIHQTRRKVKKDQATTESSKNYRLNGVHALTGRSIYSGKSGADEDFSENMENFDYITINSSDEDKIEEREKTMGAVKDKKPRKSRNDFTNGEHKTDFCHTVYDNSEKSIFRSKRTTKHDSNGNSVALLLTFSPGSTFPSKVELVSVFSKYGTLIKHETELFKDPGCARVVFARENDAKKALNDIRKNKNFPFLVVDCQSFNLPQCTDIPSPSPSNATLVYASQDLQRMIHTLSPKKGLTHSLKPEVRKDLINDIKGLLNKVNKLIT